MPKSRSLKNQMANDPTPGYDDLNERAAKDPQEQIGREITERAVQREYEYGERLKKRILDKKK